MIQGKEEIMRELFNIEPHSTGPGFLMRLKTGEIDVPDDRGGYIVSSGCGSGKTESIKSLIRNKYNDGILYCVDTKEELDKMYNWIIDNLVDVMPGLKKEDVMIISSDDEHYISLSEYKDNPEIIMQKKILLITHVRFWTDLINFFLIYKPTSDVDPFDGDFRKLMTRDDLRGYIVFDETPTFIKPFVTFSSVMMGNFTDIDNEEKVYSSSKDNGKVCSSEFIHTPEEIETNLRWQGLWTDKQLINYADKGWRKQYPDSYKDGNRHLSILSRAKWLCLYGVLFENAKDYLINTFGRHGISEFEIEGMLRNNYHSNRGDFGSKRMVIYGRKEEGKVYRAKTLPMNLFCLS